MDSLAWHRTFAVFSINRLMLRDLACTEAQITTVTNENMQAIADTLRDNLLHAAGMDFNEEVRFVTRVFVAEDSTDVHTGVSSE